MVWRTSSGPNTVLYVARRRLDHLLSAWQAAMVRVLFIFCPFAAFLRLSEQTSRHHYLSPWKFYIPHYHMLYQHILIWKCSGLYLGAVTSHYTLQWSEHTVSYTSISISRDGNLQGPCRFTYLHTCPLFSRLQQVPMHAQRHETVFVPSWVHIV